MQLTDRPGYERLKAAAAALKNRGPLLKPAPKYSNLTTDELEHLRDKAENWMKENMNNPNFDEANRRYMMIEDLLTERNVQKELFGQ